MSEPEKNTENENNTPVESTNEEAKETVGDTQSTSDTVPIQTSTEEIKDSAKSKDSTGDTTLVQTIPEEVTDTVDTNELTSDTAPVDEEKGSSGDDKNLEVQENPILTTTMEVTENIQEDNPSNEEIVSEQEEQDYTETHDQEYGDQEGELRVQISQEYEESYEDGAQLPSPGSFHSPKSKRNLRLTNSDNVLKDYYHMILPSSFLMFGLLCYIIFIYIKAFDLERVPDPSYFTRMIAFLFSTAFASIFTTSFYSLWETSDDPEKTASSYAAATLAFISWVAHLIIGFNLMPVVINWQDRNMQTVRSIEWLVEVFIMILIIECLKWRGKVSIICIFMQTAAQFCMAVGNIATETTYGIIFYFGAIFLLYSNIGFVWYSKYKYVQAESKTKEGVDPEEIKSWILLNTYFWTQTLLILCYILGYIGLFNGNFEALLISGLDLLSKVVYCSILTAKSKV